MLARTERLHRQFGQAVLVEQFVGTRELNVSVIEKAAGPAVLPLAEIDFSAFDPSRPRVVDYAAKWRTGSFEYSNTPRVIPAPIPEATATEVRRLALRAWNAAGCNDYARVDFRLDDGGRLHVLEINQNPDISPDAGFMAALTASGMTPADFVRTVVSNAERRRRAASAGH